MRSLWWSFINLQILIFLSLYHFGLGAHRFFLEGILASIKQQFFCKF